MSSQRTYTKISPVARVLLAAALACAPLDEQGIEEGQPDAAEKSQLHPDTASSWRSVSALSIANDGTVVGAAETTAGSSCPIIWREGRARGVPLPPGFTSGSANAINSSGVVAGNAYAGESANSPPDQAYVWSGGEAKRIDRGPGSRSGTSAINDAGQVVGHFGGGKDEDRSFLWTGGATQDLGAFPDDEYSRVFAHDLNNQGVVVGAAIPPYENEEGIRLRGSAAFVWQNGTMKPLFTDGNIRESAAYGINDAGQIVGELTPRTPEKGRAFVWSAGGVTLLDTLPGWHQSSASAINRRGQVVGIIWIANRGSRAVLWEAGGVRELGDLPGTKSSEASDINDHGQVVGATRDSTDRNRAFLWENSRVRELLPPTQIPRECAPAKH